MQDYIEIGTIVNTFGIKGFLKVNPYTDDIKRFEKLQKVYLVKNKERTTYEVEEVKFQKHVVLIKVKGINSIEEAERVRNYSVQIDRKDAVPLPEDTYFIVDIIGMTVYEEETGKELGILEDVFPTKSNDVYVVRDTLGKQLLLPATYEVIKTVDVPNKKMIVHLLEGLQ